MVDPHTGVGNDPSLAAVKIVSVVIFQLLSLRQTEQNIWTALKIGQLKQIQLILSLTCFIFERGLCKENKSNRIKNAICEVYVMSTFGENFHCNWSERTQLRQQKNPLNNINAHYKQAIIGNFPNLSEGKEVS